MMREIKFRAKVKHHDPMRNPENGWVEGYYFQDLTQGEMRSYIFQPPCSWEVIPETVGQFTGLIDKNGDEIWEHDIVDWDGVMLVVEFIDGGFCMHENYEDATLHDLFFERNEINLIGNRFDNPELLKTEEP